MLKRPIISEQSLKLSKLGLYTFEVEREANKRQIAQLISQKFNVEVISVNTISTPGKLKRQRSRMGSFTTSGQKKAIVRLKKGQKIALFEDIASPKEEVVVTTAEGEPVKIKEKKSLLKGTKVKIEKAEVK